MVKVTMAEVTLLEVMVVVMLILLVMSNSCRPKGLRLPTRKVAPERPKIYNKIFNRCCKYRPLNVRKCNFAAKQHLFGTIAIKNEIPLALLVARSRTFSRPAVST